MFLTSSLYLIITMMVIVMLLTMVIMVAKMVTLIMVMMMSVLDKHVLGDVANLVNPPPTSSTGKHDD